MWALILILTRYILAVQSTKNKVFRRPSQLRWGASNSLNIQEGGREEEEEGEISFLSIVSDLEAQESKENQ